MTCSPTQFAVFRIALGAFLAAHFASLWPFAEEIYSSRGMYPLDLQNPFLNIFGILRSETQINALFAGLTAASLLFAGGYRRRALSIVLWLGWASLTNRLPFLYIPSEGLVGWLLLLSAAIPSGESWSIRPRSKVNWQLESAFLLSVWIVLGVGYLASGIDKLDSPSWQRGTAIRSVLTSPIARWDALAAWANQCPLWAIQGMSWAVIAAEVGFLAMVIHPWTRCFAWFCMTAMHIGIRVSLDLHTISDPFLIAHLLIFDPRWVSIPTRFRSA